MRTGGSALMEHPAASTYLPLAPSIWRLPYTISLAEAPCNGLITFRQRIHGQVSAKPTTLLLVRLNSQLAKYIFRPQVPFEVKPITTLGGLGADGKFTTAAAKVYPPSMCCAIAKAAIDALKERSTTHYYNDNDRWHGQDTCEELLPYKVQFDPYSEELEFGADYNTNFTAAL